ncbi:MAG TPA: protein translocase subunit SecF [Candidatus Peribacter riflensis]|uniref:Protein-export membrane protein SecF n=1 Tax=Candidatus Peribacter riflensis TaxID=1735162 RepID=A0A0S1SYK9_9BACT|nr:MAG: protein-export membrane protein, SecD/SecF family [Candidatus Peribacter riflensis]OGJ77791.1 MAG: protein-export membrane protein SecF [Candidatus Peribacteria bacterium RIFOXYB1_FULL_57_12]ALM11205.1 MAG: protein-export membrane protein, SecD/SecF family [Candidatus Peribacter riflensis]ALM12308.1 MAG: protein-export membrane protein, SecD/SecF family [Candidatus Peribacter riflensis]ALM13410.1 MAG: protein-export membrane protein, SecD/SecF family [Candidatus Peribacter riflensis]
MSLIKLSKGLLVVSAIAIIASLVLLVVPGPMLSMEFTGGTLMNITLPAGKTKADLQDAVGSFRDTNGESLGAFALSMTSEGDLLIRSRNLDNETHLALLAHLEQKTGGTIEEKQFTTIGPTVGETLKRRSVYALVIASIGIVLYIAFAFHRIPRKLSPWRFGIFALVAMIHDILITTGIFVVLSRLTNFEFDTLFITALLTILGYSVNDTIIIFDRIRENVAFADKHEDFAITAERSLKETIVRTLNTSFTTLIMLLCLYFLGSESIRWFILALIIGIVLGNYSSYFIATPLLVFLRKKE